MLGNKCHLKSVRPQRRRNKCLQRNPSIAVSDVSLPEGPWEIAAGLIISVEGATAFRTLIQSGRGAELNDPLGKIGAT